jgi:hypothetical protein
MVRKVLSLFLLVYFSIYALSAASFDDIQGVIKSGGKKIPATAEEQVYDKILEVHDRFAREQNALYAGLPKDAASVAVSAKATRSESKVARSEVSSKQTKSSNSRVPDLSSVNFAMAHLCVVTDTDEIIDVPVYNMGRQAIYDSCSNGTHNVIPGIEACQEQWQKYVSIEALIFNEGTEFVKRSILLSKEKLRILIGELIQCCTSNNSKDAKNSVTEIEKEIIKYYGFVKTWNAYGCHSEQRALYDLDGTTIDEHLTEIKSRSGIKLIAACLHTRLAPCIAKMEPLGRRTCDCYNCLRNWSERWNFKQKNPEIQTLMTVSYVEYPSLIGEAEYIPEVNNPSFFLKKIEIDETFPVDPARGQSWLEDDLSFSWYHMNFYKTGGAYLNEYERDLMDIMQPLWTHCHTSYEGYKDISMLCGYLKLQRKYHVNGVKFLRVNNWPGDVLATTVSLIGDSEEDPISLSLSADDSDWNLLLRFYAIAFLHN